MKKIATTLFLLLAGLSSWGQADKPILQNRADTIAWVLGESYAKTYLNSGINVNKEKVVEAFAATITGEQSPLQQKDYEVILDQINYTIFVMNRKLQEQKAKEAAALEQNYLLELTKNNPRIHKAPQGFYYEILREGDGAQAVDHHRVTFDYKGYFMLTGEAFDQTHNPITINISDNTFSGLHQGVLLMKEGSIYRFYFPNSLAFGAKGSSIVPPYTALIYDIELHKVHED